MVCNEAKSGSVLAAHAFDFQGFDGQGCPGPPPGRLHVERAIYMVNTSQLTSQVRLGLTHQRRKDAKTQKDKGE